MKLKSEGLSQSDVLFNNGSLWIFSDYTDYNKDIVGELYIFFYEF